MLTHPTLYQLRALKLDGMVQAVIELEAREETHNLAHAEWLALLASSKLAKHRSNDVARLSDRSRWQAI